MSDEPLTSADAVREEMDVSADEYPSSDDDGVTETTRLDRWITRAHMIVVGRTDGLSDAELEQVETLVACHLAYAHVTGGVTGQRVTSVSEGEGQVSFDTSDLGEGPGGHGSPYWSHAITLTPGLQTTDFGFEVM